MNNTHEDSIDSIAYYFWNSEELHIYDTFLDAILQAKKNPNSNIFISEDLFNTASVLFRETFPNRAQIPESIYSHAAIFQLSDAFATAASCTFLIALEEATIIKNMEYENGYYHFYIDRL